MPERKIYRHLFPLNSPSSMNHRSQFSSIEGLNHQRIKNTSPWSTSNDTTIRNPFQNNALKSSSPKIVKPQMKVRKSKNDLRIARNRKRIELLSQPKLPVECRVSKSSSVSAANTDYVNIKGKNEKSNVNDSSPSTSTRFRTVTPRLLRLAQPKIHDTSSVYNFHPRSIDGAEKIEVVKVSKRIEELAEPRKIQLRTNKDPFKVNPKALKASCSTRVEELARPKGFSQPFPQLFQAYLNRAFVGS